MLNKYVLYNQLMFNVKLLRFLIRRPTFDPDFISSLFELCCLSAEINNACLLLVYKILKTFVYMDFSVSKVSLLPTIIFKTCSK